MAYFIVDAPYERCFELFFQDELGYPNFYRMTELLGDELPYQQLTLLVPYPSKAPTIIKRIDERADKLGVKSVQFGEGLETAFVFDDRGQLILPAPFKEALRLAVDQFLGKSRMSGAA